MKKIYTTKNYDQFRKMIDNREVKTRTTNKIIESIKRVGYITNPIICNERYQIIDGQNRFEALKALDMPIDYIIEEGLTIEHCRALNINQSNWSTMDWIKSYADGGNVNYKYLLNLIDAYSDMKMRVIIFAITGALINGAEVKKGEIECSPQQYAEAIKKLDWLRGVIKPLSNIDGNRWAIECAALWAYSDPDVDNANLVDAISKNYGIASSVSTIESALEQLEIIYNYRRRNKAYIKTNYLKSIDQGIIERRKLFNERHRTQPQRSIYDNRVR